MDYNLFDNSNEPYSLEAEQAVLGCLLMKRECLPQVASVLRADSFYIPQHREIYSSIISLDALGKKYDALLVLEDLKEKGVYDDAGGKNYLAQLAGIVPSTANAEAYAEIVKEKYILRTLMGMAREVADEAASADAQADIILNSAEQKIYDIRQGRTSSGPKKLGDIIADEVFEELRKKTSPDKEKYLGLSSGFSMLDKFTTGFNKSDLILIGARPAMGKTSFALNVARNIAVRGKKVVFFSLEMSNEQLAQRVLATESRVESSKFRTGEISPEEWNRIAEAASALNSAELYFDDTSTITVPEMKARVRQMKNVDCVLIDYLQLMSGKERTENRVQEVSKITRDLKLMAKDLHIPVITCSQLNRSTDARGKVHRPQLSDLRESGSIEQDADIVLMLYREGYYENSGNDDDAEKEALNAANDNKAQVLVVKNRHGSVGDVDLNWTKEFTLFSSVEKYRDEQ